MKKLLLPVCIALLLTGLFGCGRGMDASPSPAPASPSAAPTAAVTPSASPSAIPETVEDYYPILGNVHYIYEGQGIEFAAYDVYIHYATDTKAQLRQDNGGTVMARVVEVANGAVTVLYNREDSYARENYLNRTGETQEVLLMEPIEAGTSWTLADGRTRTITDVAANINTPSGTYTAVAVETGFEGGKTTQYYVKGIGLVKTVTAGDDYEITSSLAELQEDVPFTQTVRFYYPNVEDDKLYYRDTELSFYTNDTTRMILTQAYKANFEGRPGTVFSENTSINSLYLNDDGMVYIDLSGEFLTEMNAGSGYEAMILQCVANTFGGYYDVSKVILTIDNALYESGHISLGQGESLTVDTEGAIEIA
ncbi:MAG: hypothetical protein EOM54_07450 [Clostridia bacterium]|nr:hypothetical protein [Clostridia bacterium]